MVKSRIVIACLATLLILLMVSGDGVCQPVQLAPAPLMSLDQAIDIAIQNNCLIKNDTLEVGKLRYRTSIARTFQLPDMNVKALGFQPFAPISLNNFTFNRGILGAGGVNLPLPPITGSIVSPTSPVLLIHARVSQPLLQFHRIRLNVKATALNEEKAKEKLRLERQSVINVLRRSYYDALETETALRANEQTIQFCLELNRVIEQNLAQKKVLKVEELEAKKRLAEAQFESLELRNTLASQKEKLNQLIGRDVRMEFSLQAVSDSLPSEDDLVVARSKALANRGEIRQYEITCKQAIYERRIKKLERLPDLSLTFDYLSFFGIEFLPKNVVGVGLYLNWEPYDWGRKRWKIAEQEKVVQQANNNLLDIEARVTLEVNSSFRKLQEARQYLNVSQLSLSCAQEQLRVVLNKYKNQTMLLADVLQTQSALAAANHQYQKSLLSFWTAKADYEKAIGEG